MLFLPTFRPDGAEIASSLAPTTNTAPLRAFSASAFQHCRVCICAFCFIAICCSAQPRSELSPPPPLDKPEGERQARSLLARLLEQKPEQPATNSGVLKIRNAEGTWRQLPAQFDLVPNPTNWFNVYHAA